RYFLERYSEENRREPPELTTDVMKTLLAYDWPGNVRELENCMERAVVLADSQVLRPEQVKPPGAGRRLRPAGSRTGDLDSLIQPLVRVGIQSVPADEGKLYERLVEGVERELIEQVLLQCDNVQVKAATRLGMNRNTLHKKVERYSKATSGDV